VHSQRRGTIEAARSPANNRNGNGELDAQLRGLRSRVGGEGPSIGHLLPTVPGQRQQPGAPIGQIGRRSINPRSQSVGDTGEVDVARQDLCHGAHR
jgi:hypothetical protein